MSSAVRRGDVLKEDLDEIEPGRGWGLTMGFGILLAMVGVFALSASVFTGLVSVIFLGGALVVAGALEITAAFRMRGTSPYLVYGLAGVLAVVVGVLFVVRPAQSLASITLVIAAYLFASGLFRGIIAIMDRYPRWGWDAAYGALSVALGAYIAASWPVSALWVVGALVGIEIIARGATLVAASWVLRDVQHHLTVPSV